MSVKYIGSPFGRIAIRPKIRVPARRAYTEPVESENVRDEVVPPPAPVVKATVSAHRERVPEPAFLRWKKG